MEKGLAVCSGGMDSTVSLVCSLLQRPTDALHITYGCRAEPKEIQAVNDIADYYHIKLHRIDLTDAFRVIAGSALTGEWNGVSVGYENSKYTSEWVPARNTILLSVALGLAESKDYSYLILGNNAEEAVAYPDNTETFIHRFNDLIPFAVAPGVHIEVEQPIGNLNKESIVRLGSELGVPLEMTWSCYDRLYQHCGQCGSCFMRRRAFKAVGVEDKTKYID